MPHGAKLKSSDTSETINGMVDPMHSFKNRPSEGSSNENNGKK